MNIDISSLRNQFYNYTLINAVGQVAEKGTLNLRNHIITVNVSLQSFVSPGIYTFRIVGEDGYSHYSQVTFK